MKTRNILFAKNDLFKTKIDINNYISNANNLGINF